MSEFPDPRPDPLPLREALRGLRHALHRGGDALVSGLPVESLPGPTGHLARRALDDLAASARQIDQTTSALLHRLLPEAGAPVRTLADLLCLRRNAEGFGRAVYRGLRPILAQLGARDLMVRESAARAACARLPADLAGQPAELAAARIALALQAARSIRPVMSAPAEADLVLPALLAWMLWLLSDRAPAEDQDALIAATALARSLADEAEDAFMAVDAQRLADLIAEFADHV